MKAEILFFVPEWPVLDSPILHAQVLSVASFLNQHGFVCRFAGAETSPSRAREAAAMIERDYNVHAYIYPTLVPSAGAWDYWRSCRSAYSYVCSDLPCKNVTHVYARSFIGSMWARKLASKLGAISIFDIRGLVGMEKQLVSGPSIKSKLISYLELLQGSQADRLATVSENLKQYLGHKIDRHDVTVIPSCFNENSFYFDPAARKEIRDALNLDASSILLCYSGGTSAWQRIVDIISLLKEVCSADARYKALFLTTSQDEVTRRLKKAQFPSDQAFVRGCSHQEVPRYLSAADLGFIMRHDTPVNNVASPVKIGEYLACGLPVILTRGIGDYSDMLPAAGVGMLLDETTNIADQVVRFIHGASFVNLRNDAIRFAKSRLTMSANLDQYRSLYAGR
ncbi:MAG: glycosyltransferase [Nitrospiraceae bacterium]